MIRVTNILDHERLDFIPRYISIDNIPVYLVGDIHNNHKDFTESLVSEGLSNCVFIFLGDMPFENAGNAYQQFRELDDELAKRNICSFIIRGNLDNPHLWNDKSFWSGFISFKPVNSNTRFNINGNIGIVIDGAVTFDKESLVENINYWPEYDSPSLPYDFKDYGENLKNVDFIIGHSGPILNDFLKEHPGVEKFLENGFLKENLANEQKIYRQILKRYRPKRWYCGHYHFEKNMKFVWDNWSDDGVIHLKIVPKQKIMRIA